MVRITHAGRFRRTPPRRAYRRFQLALPLAFLLCMSAHAEGTADAPRAADPGWFRHIRLGDPSSPNKPFRQENITDEEVREV